MRTKVIDHINVHVPEDEVERTVEFYRDFLGFETENLEAYRTGDRSLFTFRSDEGCVIHVMPTDDFEPPGTNFNHVAVLLEDSLESVESAIEDADVEVERRRDRSDREGSDVAIYVRDPVGYTVELRPVT